MKKKNNISKNTKNTTCGRESKIFPHTMFVIMEKAVSSVPILLAFLDFCGGAVPSVWCLQGSAFVPS